MPLIELENLTKEYRSDDIITLALQNIDLEIEAGEFVAVMGASGSGKTTLLNIIGCMDLPTEGRYRFAGKEMSTVNEKCRAEMRGKEIAFVFQHFALLDDYTVYENVEIPLLAQRISKRERRKRISAALHSVGLETQVMKRPKHLSGGQKQRTAIARAIACGAQVLLADEPTGALDSKTGEGIMRIFSDLNAKGKTVIVITHDPHIASYAKRLITIQDGRILKDEKH